MTTEVPYLNIRLVGAGSRRWQIHRTIPRDSLKEPKRAVELVWGAVGELLAEAYDTGAMGEDFELFATMRMGTKDE